MCKNKMSKKKKIVISVVVVAVLMLLFKGAIIIAAIVSSSSSSDADETTTSITTSTNVSSDSDGFEFQTPEITTETETWVIEPRLVLCFKTEQGFVEKEFTAATAENLSDTKTMKVSNGDVDSVDPEVRLYGVPLGASVSVTCESMVTKAHNLDIGQNDGAYKYYYWKPTLYSVDDQGEYTFKLTIEETEESNTETVIYYKMAV